MKIIISTIVLCAFSILIEAQTTTVNYTPHNNDIVNPERGFYAPIYKCNCGNNVTTLNSTDLAALRTSYSGWQANYSAKVSLVLRLYYLENFKTSDINNAYLADIQTDFNAARSAGVKLILRFAYTEGSDDASKTWILRHITQLTPLFQANKDVIAVVQAGFIGAYGEWYTTTNFGNPPYNSATWQNRIDVLNALLSAVPTERMVQVRTPQTKQKAVYGVNAATNSAASYGRIGHHNDCFLASASDIGTYANYSTGADDTTNLKPYTATDSEQVAVGGETCAANGKYEPFDNCVSGGGIAEKELARFHYSYLNGDYNNADVNNDWTNCISNIKNKLGYRFELISGTYPNTATVGGALAVNFSLKNVGYAAPFNPRSVELILKNANGTKYYATVNTNPRQWYSNITQNINETFCLPATIPTGNYELLLNLPDPTTTLYSRPEYAIQFANNTVWDAATGYNKLLHTVSISGSGACSGRTLFTTTSTVVPIELLAFKGQLVKDVVELDWQTASEKNNVGFEIERSANATHFENIGFVKGKGTVSTPQYYSFTDPKPNNGVNYYRLRQIDLDGIATYSNVIAVQFSPSIKLQIFPNPAKDRLTIISQPKKDYSIVDILGRKILRGSLLEDRIDIDISKLPTGMYLVKIDAESVKFFKK